MNIPQTLAVDLTAKWHHNSLVLKTTLQIVRSETVDIPG